MTWDPEIHDAPPRPAEEPTERPLETPAEAPREPRMPLGRIDASAPVSGHVPPAESSTSVVDAPEQNWETAAPLIFPALRPPGTTGMRLADIDIVALGEGLATHHHSQPLLDDGPAGLALVYALTAGGFDVIVNGEHLLGWGIPPAELQEAALRNLAAWSATAPWTDEASGGRRLISSDAGDGWDASRILLPDIREHLVHELGDGARVLVGLPERHLLIAGSLRPGDEEFAGLFADFVIEHSGGADEPVDRRVFEIVDGQLVEFATP
jgi:hypothetical protein